MTPYQKTLETSLLAACGLCLLVMLHNQMAWIILVLTYLILWKSHNKWPLAILIISMISLSLHHVIAYIASHQLFTLPIHDLDPRGHHLNAVMPLRRLPPCRGDLFFQRSIEWLYWIKPSWFLASEVLVLFYTWALIGFNQLISYLKFPLLAQVILVCLFGLLPQTIIWTSAPLKESLQLCGFVWLLLTTTQLLDNNIPTRKAYPLIVLIALGLIMLHKATATMILLLFSAWIILFADLSNQKKLTYALIIIISLGTLAILPVWGGQAPIALLRDALIHFHAFSKDFVGNTNFPSAIQFYPANPSWMTLITHTVKQFVYYLLGPFPPEWSQHGQLSVKMILLSTYAWVRLAILVTIVWHTHRMPPLIKKRFWLFGSSYLIITAVFSLGAFNYGQALRHHTQTDWMLWILFALLWYNGLLKNKGIHNGRL